MLVRKVILCYARSNLSEDKQSEALSERKTNSYAVSEGVKKATRLRNFIPHAQDEGYTRVVAVKATFVQM